MTCRHLNPALWNLRWIGYVELRITRVLDVLVQYVRYDGLGFSVGHQK